MVRRSPQPLATTNKILECVRQACPSCGSQMWNDYDNYRQGQSLKGAVQLQLKVRRCPQPDCVFGSTNRIDQKRKGNGRYRSMSLDWM